MYHHIGFSPVGSQYYVTPEKFTEQMWLLHAWGYTTITTTMLAEAIREGAELPPRPVLITFDDGNLDNYTNAYPLMQAYGFTGVLYIVGNYIGVDNYLSAAQIKEMARAGWEIGSHTMNHHDLTKLSDLQKQYEITDSREFLEEKLGVPIRYVCLSVWPERLRHYEYGLFRRIYCSHGIGPYEQSMYGASFFNVSPGCHGTA